MTKVIAIANQKGGVGKTSTTVNLSAGLVRAGYSVLAIDFDPQANLTMALGFRNPDDMGYTVSSVLAKAMNEEPINPAEGILTSSEGIDREGADIYSFNDYQREMLNEMMKPEYCSYYTQLLGVDVSGDTDIGEILDLLPDEKGAEVVRAAMTKLGAPYVLGAKGDDKFDCSGLVYWAINEVDPDLGSHFWRCAADQAHYCENMTVGETDLRPGDLVFWVNRRCNGCGRWNEVHHTGIYIGMGKVIEASSSKGRVVIRDLWSTTNYPIFMFARPYN